VDRLRRDLAEALRAKAGVFTFGSEFGVRSSEFEVRGFEVRRLY
jgi:hypothetical protein